MSDDIWVEDRKDETPREQPEDGQYAAKIGGVWDVGMQKGFQDKPPRRKVCVAFEIDARDSKGRRFVLFAPYAMSLYEKAPLRHLLDNLFPKEPKERFNLGKLRGADCLVQVSAGDNGKARVTAVLGLPKGMTKITTEGDYTKPIGLAKYLIENQIRKAAASKPAAPEPDPEESVDPIPF